MRFHPLLLLAAGLTGTLAHPGPSPAALSTIPGPATEGSDVTTRDDIDPSTCPTVRCKDTYHAVYTPGQKHCTCEPNYPDPSTCPTIKCASWSHPVYHPETKACSCEPNPPECPNAIFCAAGCHKVQDPSSKKCGCEITNPIPKTCPQFKCLEYHHVVYHPETDKCGCDVDCPELTCIAEARPIYNFSTNSCSCQYIPGLEPSPIREREAQVSPSPTPAPSKPGTPIACSKIMCIPEKHPVYNATSGHCDCQWINGFDPLPVKSKPASSTLAPVPIETVYVDPIRCSEIFCISEQHGVFNATTGKCECAWIPGLKPGEPTTLLARTTPTRGPLPACSGIMCIPEMKPVFNETSGKCECEWMDIFKPPINSWTSLKPTSSPSPTSSKSTISPTPTLIIDPPPLCAGIFCFAEQTPVYNFTSGTCECPLTDGLGPVPTSSTSTRVQTWISSPVPIPTPTRAPSCLKPGYYCVPEMEPVYNATSGVCSCEWIPGLGPVTIKA